MSSIYAQLGVDADKRGVKASFDDVTASGNLYPHSFCPVYDDPSRKGYGRIMHADGAGSKSIQNLLHYKVTGNEKVLGYIADDVVAMNLGDALSVNAEIDGFVDYVAVNRFAVPKEVLLQELAKGFRRVFEAYAHYGIKIPFMGGETADLPDQLRSLDVTGTVYGHVRLKDAISGEGIKPGDVIVGIRSDDQAFYETGLPNSGIMSNGLTLARHCLMTPEYQELYPEIGTGYTGRFRTDEWHPDLRMTVGEALISPTRQFGILMNQLRRYGNRVHGIVHNTGGGQTKCLRIGSGFHFVKDNLPEPPPIFYLIQRESGEAWADMHRNFNMGIGVDIIVPAWAEEFIIHEAANLGIDAQKTGYIDSFNGHNTVTIKSRFGEFNY